MSRVRTIANRLRVRFGLRLLFVLVTLFGVVFGLSSLVYNHFFQWILNDGPKPITSPDEWPDMLHGAVGVAGTSVITDVHAHDLGGFIDSEYIWRMKVPEDSLPPVLAILNLDAFTGQHKVPSEFWRLASVSWWTPSTSPTARLFKSQYFDLESRGRDGEHSFALYETETQQLYVWHKYNF